jgi:tripartite ATP-independent transporter DctP family solute receptor
MTERKTSRAALAFFALPLGLLVLAGWRATQTPGADATVLRLAHALNAEHPVHGGMLAFADEVARRSEGRLRIEIDADGKLGSERELVEQVQLGSLALTKASAGQLEAFAPDYMVFGLPYLFDDVAHFWRFAATPAAETLLASSEPKRLVGLTFYDAGARSFYLARGRRPVRRVDDLAGLSLRVMPSQTAMRMVEAFGAKPVPIPFGELYTAIDSGTVDGAENNAPSLFTSRQFEVAGSYSLNGHLILPDVLVIGTDAWSRLSAADQQVLREAARHSMHVQRRLWDEDEARSLAGIRAAGVEIIEDVDREGFRTATAAFPAELMARRPSVAPLIDAIETTRAPAAPAAPVTPAAPSTAGAAR